MFEILVFLALIAWILLSVWLAARIARLVRPTVLKALIFVPAALIFISLSVADEIVGKYQFDSLCADVGDVNVFGKIPVGSELYLPDGTWKLRRIAQLSFEEFNRTRRIYDSLVRRETAHTERSTEAIPISEFDTKIISQSSGKVLASYRSYGTSGGWLSRRMEKPILVRSQCLPASYDKIDQSVLPYRDAAGGNK